MQTANSRRHAATCEQGTLPTLQGHQEQQHPAGRLGTRQGDGRRTGLPFEYSRPERSWRHLCECATFYLHNDATAGSWWGGRCRHKPANGSAALRTFRQEYMLRQHRALMIRACRCTCRRRSCLAPGLLRMQQRPGPQRKCDNNARGAPLCRLLQQRWCTAFSTASGQMHAVMALLTCCLCRVHLQAGDCYAFGVVLWELVTGELPVRARMWCAECTPVPNDSVS